MVIYLDIKGGLSGTFLIISIFLLLTLIFVAGCSNLTREEEIEEFREMAEASGKSIDLELLESFKENDRARVMVGIIANGSYDQGWTQLKVNEIMEDLKGQGIERISVLRSGFAAEISWEAYKKLLYDERIHQIVLDSVISAE